MRHRTINNSGVKDIGRNLGILKNTVISELKKTLSKANPYFMPQADGIEIEIKMDTEADELWSYVGGKKIRGGSGMQSKAKPA